MPVAVWGNGATSKPINVGTLEAPNWTSQITLLADTQYVVCDDFVPYPRKQWRRRYYQRISVNQPTQFLPHLPLDGSAFAQKIREGNRLYAVDELVFPLAESKIANLESAIYQIGSNDLPADVVENVIYREPSEIVFAVAGNIQHATATRFFNAVIGRNSVLAAAGKHRSVRVAWEGYHTASVWGAYDWATMYNDLRIVDREMLAKARTYNLQTVSWMLQTFTDREDYAEVNYAPHYAASSYDPEYVKRVADEDCFYEALVDNYSVIGVWMAYTTEGSRYSANDVIRRAQRRKNPLGVRDQG